MNPVFSYPELLLHKGKVKEAFQYLLRGMDPSEQVSAAIPELRLQVERYERLEKSIKIRLLPRELAQKEMDSSKKYFQQFLENLSKEAKDMEHLSSSFSAELFSFFDLVEGYGAEKNIYPYTPVLLMLLLRQSEPYLKDYFEAYQEGTGAELEVSFARYIEEILIEKKAGVPFESVDWLHQQNTKLATSFAWIEQSEEVMLKHFLLGIIHSDSQTIAALESENGFDREAFTEIVLRGKG